MEGLLGEGDMYQFHSVCGFNLSHPTFCLEMMVVGHVLWQVQVGDILEGKYDLS